jgi:hypothetical protein
MNATSFLDRFLPTKNEREFWVEQQVRTKVLIIDTDELVTFCDEYGLMEGVPATIVYVRGKRVAFSKSGKMSVPMLVGCMNQESVVALLNACIHLLMQQQQCSEMISIDELQLA